MSLAPATRVGPYEIQSLLGTGGMGEVYRAHDPRLGRDVAIKVLPPQFSADTERAQRFRQEARTLAALRHPNIVTVHDVGEENGQAYLVSELVEGEDLRKRLRRGFSVGEALDVAIQCASGLAAAHRAGIVHRDMKPENILIAPDGSAKILDFGLAKQAGSNAPTDDTETIAETSPGVLLGTVGYMSPEQASCRPADRRSDLFSLGAVLYEMITGQRAFEAKNGKSAIEAILTEEPPPVSSRRAVPAELDRIVRRCLRKDPARRFQYADDLKVELEEAREELHQPSAAPRRRRIWPWLVSAAAIGAVLALGGVRFWPRAEQPEQISMRRLTFDAGLSTDGAISPDGKLVAYASDQGGAGNLDIWVQQADGSGAVRLTDDPADDYEPSFSPDGTHIVFRSERNGGGLYVVPALGGEPRLISREGHYASYSPDGSRIAYTTNVSGDNPNGKGIFVVPAGGGTPQPLPDFSAFYSDPVWISDNQLAVLAVWKHAADVWIVPVDKPESAVKTGLMGPRIGPNDQLTIKGWDPIRHRLIVSVPASNPTDVWAAELNPSTWKPVRPPQRITTSGQRLARWSGARNGDAVVSFANALYELLLFPLDNNAAPHRVLADMAFKAWPELSRDGNLAVFARRVPPYSTIWSVNLATGKAREVTATSEYAFYPTLSSDGSRVYYTTERGQLSAAPLAGGLSEQIGKVYRFDHVSPDGRFFLSHGNSPAGHMAVWIFDRQTGKFSTLLTARDRHLYQPRFSADTRWITFLAKKTDISTLYAAPFRGPEAIPESEWIPLTEGEFNDDKPRLSEDRRHLYFVSNRDGFWCIYQRELDPATMHPAGPISAVRHLHTARESLSNTSIGDLEISVAKNKLLTNVSEIAGSVWLMQSRKPGAATQP